VTDIGTSQAEDRDDPLLVERVRALIDNGQTLAEAELAFQKARIGFALGRAKSILLLLVLALFGAFFTFVALVVGLLLALTPLVGAWAALGLVGLGLLLMTVACISLASAKFRAARRIIMGDSQ
jgi:hypothetical protein